MKNIFIYLNLFIFLSINLYAQSINGTIFGISKDDEKIPLSKATIKWAGTNEGTYSDENGNFRINQSKSSKKLIISYIGYRTDTLEISNPNESLTVNLKSDLTIQGVTVTAKSEQAVINTSDVVNSFSITERGLRKAACCNLAESFVTNAAADVEYTDAVSGARQIKLLGLQGTYTQLLYENMPGMRGLASAYGLGFIPGPWMQNISISKGTASVVNGFEAITGQINVDFKKPEDLKPLYLNFFGDQFGRLEANSDISTQISENLTTMTLFHANLNQFAHDYNNDNFSDHPLLGQLNLLNRWKYHGENHESVSGLQVIYEDRKGGQMSYLDDKLSDAYGIEIASTRVQAFSKNGFFLDEESGSSIGTILNYTYHQQDSRFGNRIFDASQHSFYTNLIYDYNINKSVGADKNYHQDEADECKDDHNKSESEGYTDLLHNFKSGVSFQMDLYRELFGPFESRIDEYIPGIFSEYTFLGIQNFAVTAGIRADWHNKFGWFVTPRIHAKYNFDEKTVWRFSAGKGSRTAYPLAENASVLASSRMIVMANDLKREEAINFGSSFTSEFQLFDMPVTLNLDFYRTWFVNQLVVDMDLPGQINFSNLDGESYSNSFQVDFIFEPLEGFIVTTAYRYNEVMSSYHGNLLEKSLQSPHRAFLNLAYSTDRDDWILDFTVNYNSSGRIPALSHNPQEYRLDAEYPGYFSLHGQITRRFVGWEIYLGGENLTDYRQPNPIIGFDKPFGPHFDSSMIWGPIMGRVIYMGIRISKDI